MSGTRLTILFLIIAIGVIVAALFVESSSNPTFRPGDYDSYQECVAAIPRAWSEGSIDWVQAEASCRFTHTAPDR